MPKKEKEPATPTKSPGKNPPTPKRTPKSSFKGDELGKNKKQSSIMQFFTPKDKESPLQMVVSKPKSTVKEGPRKALKFPINPSLTSEPIVISDEDSPRSPQASMDQFHAKTKLSQTAGVKKEKSSILSRKSQKLKSNDSPSSVQSKSKVQVPPKIHVTNGAPMETNGSNGVEMASDDVVSIASSEPSQNDVNSPCHNNDSDLECSPTKRFRKQFVADSQAMDEVENSILKQITPSNKPKLLSTKSRKRKNPATPSPPSLASPPKKPRTAETSPVPRGSNEFSPKIDQGSTGLEMFSTENVSPPSKETENREDSEENDSSQIFAKSPLRPSSLVNKAEPPKVALRVKPFLDLLSPRYLADPLVTSMKKDLLLGPKRVSESSESTACKGPPAPPAGITPIKTASSELNPVAAELPAKLQNPSTSCNKKKSSNADSSTSVNSTQKGLPPPARGVSKSSGSRNPKASLLSGGTPASLTGTSLKTASADRLAVPENPLSKLQNSDTPSTRESNVQAGASTSGSAPSSRITPTVAKTYEPPSGKPDTASSVRQSGSVEVALDLSLDKVDWSEPLEQELIHASTAKRPQSAETTPNKSNPADAPNKPKPVKFGPLTPSKVPSTPTKSPKSGPSTSSQSTPRKSFWSPKKASPRKFGSPFKTELTSGNLLLQHCIEECKRYAKMALKLNATNKKVADDYISLDHPEKLLLHHLLMRKWSWIRQCDMNYSKFIPQIGSSLGALQEKGFLEGINVDEDLEVILAQLKKPELVQLCRSHKIDFKGVKPALAARLVNFANRQGGLSFATQTLKSTMMQTAVKMNGTCVRIAERPRQALQQIFEACMSPIFLDGKNYTFQERMRGMGDLMDSVKFHNKKLIDFNLSDSQLFLSTSQFDEYISSTVLKFDLLAAKERKDNAKGIELAKDAQASLLISINSQSVQEYLDKMPRYAWRYTAGSNYTAAVDKGIEFFKKSKAFGAAVVALDVLLTQERFRKHCRGNWYAEKVLILDKHLKQPPGEIYRVIMTGLQDDLTPIGRLELSKKAEILLNKKKNGLDADQITAMRKLMRIPLLNHPVKQIKCVEAPNMSTGTRQTFVEVSAEGDRTYCDVEQSARNTYMDEYPEGLHDEGSLVKNIILAAFWPVIYMPMDEMFVSKYQHSPLDWGTRPFYTKREKEIKSHIEKLREGGIEGVVQQITDVLTLYSNSHSLIDWGKIAHDMLPMIKNVLTCLTVDKFLLLADYLLEAFRERRSGWPDLTLWNTVARTFKLVEVKSPNDELSFKQVVWLEKFLEMGIPVEECRVNSSNKNKKRKAMAAHVNNSDASQEVL